MHRSGAGTKREQIPKAAKSPSPARDPGPIGHPTFGFLALIPTLPGRAGLSRRPRAPTPSEPHSSLPGSSPPPDDVKMPSIGKEENVVSPEPGKEGVCHAMSSLPRNPSTRPRREKVVCSSLQRFSLCTIVELNHYAHA